MVLCGGLELVAAGYIYHRHQQHKREKALLKEELAQAEEELEREESREERKERHRRRRSRERREREKWEAEHPHDMRPGRTNSAPLGKIHGHMSSPALVPTVAITRPAQTQQPNPAGLAFPPTGWPAHWKQTHTPPTPPPAQSTTNLNAGSGYPPDIKYGFVPEVPHDQYPPYPPPPFSPGPSGRDGRGRRAQTLDVNEGRHGRRHRRSASPRIGVVDEFDDRGSRDNLSVSGSGRDNGNGRERRSPVPRVRFSTEDVVLGGSGRSPPPSYTSRGRA
jgi:hypothetical protein